MDKKTLIEMLDKGADFIAAVAPIAGAGTVGKVFGIIGAVEEIVKNLTDLAKEGKAVLQADEVGEVDEALARVRRANDALAERINAS